jgi:ketosteroid isomerase-like protein
MATSTENKQLVEDAYAAMVGGDIKGFLAVLDSGVEVIVPPALPYGGTYRGVREFIAMLPKAAPVLDTDNLVVESLIADADRVVAILRVPLRSGAGEAVILENWRMLDGKATQLQVFWFDTGLVTAT